MTPRQEICQESSSVPANWVGQRLKVNSFTVTLKAIADDALKSQADVFSCASAGHRVPQKSRVELHTCERLRFLQQDESPDALMPAREDARKIISYALQLLFWRAGPDQSIQLGEAIPAIGSNNWTAAKFRS